MSLRIATTSGAVYDYRVDDDDRTFIRRNGPPSDGIDYATFPDDSWHEVFDHTVIEYGSSIFFDLAPSRCRITTPVVAVEEVED